MKQNRMLSIACAGGVLLLGGVFALAQNKPAAPPKEVPKESQKEGQEEGEKKVTEAQVPKAALDALKKLAGGAAITEFAEEIEHGRKFYEGSWKGANGNVDGLVTEAGDLVEIEEAIPGGQAPAVVRTESEKAAGKGAEMTFEKKTMVIYEVHYKKEGKPQEAVFTPDGRKYQADDSKKKEGKEEDEEDEKD